MQNALFPTESALSGKTRSSARKGALWEATLCAVNLKLSHRSLILTIATSNVSLHL